MGIMMAATRHVSVPEDSIDLLSVLLLAQASDVPAIQDALEALKIAVYIDQGAETVEAEIDTLRRSAERLDIKLLRLAEFDSRLEKEQRDKEFYERYARSRKKEILEEIDYNERRKDIFARFLDSIRPNKKPG